ncbi:hypothetical protein EWM64_g3761 [Hericium alpestre]|uniref:Uncharacterized protein n=1 Tax=Hericium alpestre TaxID=135208 RepID=A0A4Z0A1A1_9AGAM|nr:hypothetical protein EWM64_g3761 [Hericium alpestre]
MLRGLMERAWSPVGAARRAPPPDKFAIGASHLAYVRYFHRTPIEADFGLLPDTHSWRRKDLPTVMEKLRQTHTNISDLFSRLAVEKASLDSALQRCAERDVQDHELLSAVSDFAERQRRVEDDVRGLLDRQSESDEVLEEGMMRLFKEKREKDQGYRREIEGLFEESVRGAQEIEQLLRRFDIAVLPADGSSNTGLANISNPFTNSLASPTLQSFESVDKESVSLTPLDTPKRPSSSLSSSPPPDIPETKPEPQEWDFFDYEEGVVWGSEGKPPIKPPASFAEFCESKVAIPADPLRT